MQNSINQQWFPLKENYKKEATLQKEVQYFYELRGLEEQAALVPCIELKRISLINFQ